MLFRSNLHKPFKFGKNISIAYQNSTKSVFFYSYGFNYLIHYNLVVCYSLDPVLVIWYIFFNYFFINSMYFSK